MAWQRFNRTTNVFEVSDNNGASWQTLVIAAAGVNIPPVTIPPNIAFTNVTNQFSLRQQILGGGAPSYAGAPIEIQNADARISFHLPGVVASQIGIENDGTIKIIDNPGTGYEKLKAISLYGTGSGNSFGDLTCRGATNFQGGILVTAGNLTVNAGAGTFIGSTFDVQSNMTYLRVGCRVGLDAPNGTGLATWFEESSNHIRAAGGLYDYGRGSPIGTWTDFSPSIAGANIVAVYAAKYMIVGKTMTICIYLNMDVPTTAVLTMPIPAGQTTPNSYGFAVGLETFQPDWPWMLQAPPNSASLTLYRNVVGAAWPNAARTIGATITFQIA